MRATGVDCVQLALSTLRPAARDSDLDSDLVLRVTETATALTTAGIAICSGMMSMRGEDYSTLESIRSTGGLRPDAHWEANRARAEIGAELSRTLRIELVTLHAGFLPHDRRDPERAKLLTRLRAIVDIFAARGVRVGFETGQETAETLLDFLGELDRPTAGVNFDPANMILYGMGDPVVALEVLGPRVLQVHVKDAKAARIPGTWGEEVAVGEGQVDWPRFFAVLDAVQPAIDLMIEREAGVNRVDDIRRACAIVHENTGKSYS